ncbi:hypothetical protein RUND412_008431 [Rhizina undulata]
MPKRPARLLNRRRARMYLHAAATAIEAAEGIINFGTVIAVIVWFLLERILLELVADKIAERLAEKLFF